MAGALTEAQAAAAENKALRSDAARLARSAELQQLQLAGKNAQIEGLLAAEAARATSQSAQAEAAREESGALDATIKLKYDASASLLSSTCRTCFDNQTRVVGGGAQQSAGDGAGAGDAAQREPASQSSQHPERHRGLGSPQPGQRAGGGAAGRGCSGGAKRGRGRQATESGGTEQRLAQHDNRVSIG